MQYLAPSPPPPPPPCIINFSLFKNAIKSEKLGVRGYYFQDFHISMIPTNGKNFKKIHEIRVTYPEWFNMELPNEEFFHLRNRCYDHCKNVFSTHFHSSSCQGSIPSSKSCNLLAPTITEKVGLKKIKITAENLSKSCILCQLLSTKTLDSGSKCIKHFFLFLPLFALYLLSGCVLFNMSCLSWIYWCLVWIFCAPTSLTWKIKLQK